MEIILHQPFIDLLKYRGEQHPLRKHMNPGRFRTPSRTTSHGEDCLEIRLLLYQESSDVVSGGLLFRLL